MGISIGGLIRSAVTAVGGGLKGQNEGDELLYQHRRDERADALRRYVAERQMKAEERAVEQDRSEAAWRRRQGEHYEAMDRPEWQRQGYPSFNAWDADTHEPAPQQPRNIDPLSPEGQKARTSLETVLSRIPSRSKRGTPEGDDEDIKDLNTTIDDKAGDIVRAQRKAPVPWSALPVGKQGEVTDSMAYKAADSTARAQIDSLEGERDRFGHVRDSLVAKRHGIAPPPPAGPAQQLPITGNMDLEGSVDPVELTPGAGHSRPPSPAANLQLSAALHDLQTQYEEKLAWRGPNGERKDPAVLKARYLEALAQIQAGSR